MCHSSVADRFIPTRLNGGEVGEQQEMKIGKYVKLFTSGMK